MVPNVNTDGWGEWSRHVLSELKRHNGLIEQVRADLSAIRTDIATLKVKSGLWGMLGGVAVAVPMVLALMRIIK